ncbi:MAG: MarR family transcriptional regulator [Alphaproteobacteria bacterium]
MHLEILQYLSMCNRYSNTAQALEKYSGQTKGSSLKASPFMEEAGYIERKLDLADRAMRLSLTKEGKALLKRIDSGKILAPDFPEDDAAVEMIQRLLSDWQSHNGLKSFGQCKSCRFNKTVDGGRSQCMLTGEALSKSDVRKICREHEFAGTASAPLS